MTHSGSHHHHDHEEHDHCCHDHHDCCEGHEHHHEHHDSFAEQLLELADEAWMEILKEKIKDQIKSTEGKNLDELAKIVSEANHKRWSSILSEQNTKHGLKEKLENFFKSE